MIQNKVVKLLKETKLPNGVTFPANQELEIVMDVIYAGGYPIPFAMQETMLKWVNENPTLFKDVTLKW